MALALRLFYYQGALQGLAMLEEEGGTPTRDRYNGAKSPPQYNEAGVDMRHNAVAAKAAAKGLKNDNGEVKYVPASVFLSLPEVQAEYVDMG